MSPYHNLCSNEKDAGWSVKSDARIQSFWKSSGFGEPCLSLWLVSFEAVERARLNASIACLERAMLAETSRGGWLHGTTRYETKGRSLKWSAPRRRGECNSHRHSALMYPRIL